MPYNLFNVTKIANGDRTKFNIKSRIVSYAIGIIGPIFLGSLITVTNYIFSAIVILIISFVQILFTFLLKPDLYDKDDDFNPIKAYKKFKTNKQTLRSFNSQFLVGMTVNNSALELLLVVLVYSTFKSDFNLGVLSSISTILSIITMKLYEKIYSERSDKKLILFIGSIPILLVAIMAFFKNNIALVICYILYMVLVELLKLTQTVRTDNVANSYIVKKTEQCEYNEIREIYLDLGRIVSFAILLFVVNGGTDTILNVLMVLFSVLIGALGINIVRKFFLKK